MRSGDKRHNKLMIVLNWVCQQSDSYQAEQNAICRAYRRWFPGDPVPEATLTRHLRKLSIKDGRHMPKTEDGTDWILFRSTFQDCYGKKLTYFSPIRPLPAIDNPVSFYNRLFLEVFA